MDRMEIGRRAIGTIMGKPGEEAHTILTEWYGEAIANEVIGIGGLWERPVLTKRERSFVAIAALATLGTLERLLIPGAPQAPNTHLDQSAGSLLEIAPDSSLHDTSSDVQHVVEAR